MKEPDIGDTVYVPHLRGYGVLTNVVEEDGRRAYVCQIAEDQWIAVPEEDMEPTCIPRAS